jgi:hypothetical protein
VTVDSTAVQFWVGTLPAGVTADGATPAAARTNLVQNPSSEAGPQVLDSSGSGATLTRTSEAHAVGGWASKVTVGSGWAFVRPTDPAGSWSSTIVPGQTYTYSAYVWTPLSSVKVLLRLASTAFDSYLPTTPNTWTRISRTFTAADVDTYVDHGVGYEQSDNAAGATFYVDGVMLEQSATLGSYVDGTGATEQLVAPPFTPAQAPGCVLWLDARYVTGQGGTQPADGAAVASWADLSGGSSNTVSQSTSSARPLFSATTPSLTFDGTNDYLSAGVVPFPAGGPFSMYVVARPAVVNKGMTFAVLDSSTNTQPVIAADISASAVARAFRRDDAADLALASITTGNVLHLWSAVSPSAASVTLWRDGAGANTATVSPMTGDGTTSVTELLVGARRSTTTAGVLSSFLQGSISAVLMFSVAHDDATRHQVEQYLVTAFGLSGYVAS